MLQPQSNINVADNSGAKKLMCIRVLGSNRRYAAAGDVFIGVVKEAGPNFAIKRSDVVRAVVVRTKQPVHRKDGSRLRFDENAAVIVDKENNPRGTRVFGPVSRELKVRGFTKIASLAPEII